jgi:alkylation response protein AidB-like acyl-CoA dehydrogenase
VTGRTPDVSGIEPLDGELDGLLERLVEDRLVTEAEATDRADHLPPAHFEALAGLGLYGMVVPAADGGLALRPTQVRAVLRRVGSGCGATAFAFAQHHGTTATVVTSPNAGLRDAWLGGLAGRGPSPTLAGIAYAHVRRPGQPVLTAKPAGAGDEAWLLDGQAPWVTSWGLADVFGVAARTGDGRLVWALVPGREAPGLRMAKRFDLAVLGATATVALAFDGYRVEPDHLVDVVDFDAWAEHDRHLAARPNPLCLGVGDRALRLLADADPDRAARLTPAWDDLGRRAEEQARAVDERRADLRSVARLRAETVLATQRLTTGLLAAVGGRGMERGHPAQRLHREAGFYVVQAQNEAGREAMLDGIEVGG